MIRTQPGDSMMRSAEYDIRSIVETLNQEEINVNNKYCY